MLFDYCLQIEDVTLRSLSSFFYTFHVIWQITNKKCFQIPKFIVIDSENIAPGQFAWQPLICGTMIMSSVMVYCCFVFNSGVMFEISTTIFLFVPNLRVRSHETTLKNAVKVTSSFSALISKLFKFDRHSCNQLLTILHFAKFQLLNVILFLNHCKINEYSTEYYPII